GGVEGDGFGGDHREDLRAGGWGVGDGALAICERAAALFPSALRVGVDLLPLRGWRRFAVGEVNAFGDLLPGLMGLPGGGAEGLDTYGAQIAAVRARAARAVPAGTARTGPPSAAVAPPSTAPSTAPRAGNERATG
ncbi:hypothetical protein ACFW15_31720, partial [Streptomyces sp. NPDC058953]